MTNLLIRWFVKDFQDVANFQVRERYGKFAGMVGIGSNLLLFLIKILTGLAFNSIAIIADAVNNLSDCGSSLVTMLGFRMSGKPADAEHPFGHARMEYLSGLAVSFIVLFLGIQLLQSAFQKIIHPQPVDTNLISLLVLVVSIVIKLWQCLFYRKIGKVIVSTTLMATSIDSRNDIFATGSIFIAAVITLFTGFDLDGYMGLVVAIFILISGGKLVMETSSPLLGIAPNRDLVEKINRKILSYEHIIGLHDLTVHSYGASKCFASVHCEVSAEQDIMMSHDIIDNIERDFLKNDHIHLVIHLDPVVTGDARTNELKREIEMIVKQLSPELEMHDFRVVWGISHSNLIFDVVVPFDFKMSDGDLIEAISNRIFAINPKYYAVITIDHNYTPA